MMNEAQVGEALASLPVVKAQHKQGGFHEQQPCGGCHFWAGYEGALRDVLNGRVHSAFNPTARAAILSRSDDRPPE